MPGKFDVRYLPIAQDSPSRAVAFLERVDKKIGNLAFHSRMGRIPQDEKLRGLGYHVLIVRDFLVFYVLHGRTVQIHRVLHGSRHYSDII